MNGSQCPVFLRRYSEIDQDSSRELGEEAKIKRNNGGGKKVPLPREGLRGSWHWSLPLL